jgi:hypothetical protein
MLTSKIAILFVAFLAILFIVEINEVSGGNVVNLSQRSHNIANRFYPSSPAERFVATRFGDTLPRMRNELINRRNNGESFTRRHFNAWRNRGNWRWQRPKRSRGRYLEKIEKLLQTDWPPKRLSVSRIELS